MPDSFIPVTQLPSDFVAGGSPPVSALPADTQGAPIVSQGSFLPISRDAAGNMHFDPNAGILGAAISAFTLPHDVYTGAQPIAGPQGGIDPQLTGRALGAATFMSPASVAMRAGELVPGALARNAVPTAGQLKNAANIGYDAARGAGLDISGDAVANMATGLQQSLTGDRGIIAKTAPKTFAILDELANPPPSASTTIGIPGLDAAREGLSNISLEGGTDGLAARTSVRGIDDFMSSLDDNSVAASAPGAPPVADVAQTLANARGNYAAAQRSNAITGTLDRANTGVLDRAEARADASHSGANIDNAIRQRVASFLQNPSNVAGFSQPELDALNGVVSGGPIQNAARAIGNLFGGGGGLGHLFGMVSGFGIGHALGGDAEAGAIGAMLPSSIGISAKALENALARRNLADADQIIRMNSPLYRAMQMQGETMRPAVGPNVAAQRMLLPGLLSQDQPGTPY